MCIPKYNDYIFSSAPGKGAVFFSPSHQFAFVLLPNLQIVSFSLQSSIPTIFFLNSSLLFCPDETTLAIFPIPISNISVCCKSPRQITLFVSQAHQRILAYSTTNFIVVVASLKSGTVLGEINVEDEVLNLLITTYWGFVVAKTFRELFIISGEGQLLKRVSFLPNLKFFQTISSYTCFDYVIFQTPNGDLFYIEAYFPEKNFSPLSEAEPSYDCTL